MSKGRMSFVSASPSVAKSCDMNLEDGLEERLVGAEGRPEAQLQFFIENLGPEDQAPIRSIRSALRNRLPTANELVHDYYTFFTITFSPTEHPSEGIITITRRDDGMRLYLMKGPHLPDPK